MSALKQTLLSKMCAKTRESALQKLRGLVFVSLSIEVQPGHAPGVNYRQIQREDALAD
jgi:hypothetical protein